MFDTTFIEANYTKQNFPDHRWLFRPRTTREGLTHIFLLTYVAKERRFVLAKRKIMPIEPVDDVDLLKAFEGTLLEKEIADCLSESLNPADDDLPF